VSDFILEITGARGAISLEPVGIIDTDGAKTLLEAVGTLRSDRTALLEIRLDRVTGLTDDARQLLHANQLPLEAVA
jgi:hypothetical protein